MVADRSSLLKTAEETSGACMQTQSERAAMQDMPQSNFYRQICHASHCLGHRERRFLTS